MSSVQFCSIASEFYNAKFSDVDVRCSGAVYVVHQVLSLNSQYVAENFPLDKSYQFFFSFHPRLNDFSNILF